MTKINDVCGVSILLMPSDIKAIFKALTLLLLLHHRPGSIDFKANKHDRV